MKTAALVTLGVLLSAPAAQAQEAPTQIVVGALRTATAPGGLFQLGTGTTTTFQAILGSISMEQNPASLALDGIDPTTVYVGTYGRRTNGDPGPCHVVALRIAKGKVLSIRRLNAKPMSEDYISAVVPIGDQVFYLGRRTIGSVPKTGGPVRQLLELRDWMEPRGMSSDGRFLYAAVGPWDIVRVDLARPTVFGQLAQVRSYPGEEIQNLAIGNAGNVFVVTADVTRKARLLLIDHVTGTLLRQMRLPLVGARAVAQDPDTDTIYVVGGKDTSGSTSAVTIDHWRVSKGPTGYIPNALPSLILMKPRNIFRRGVACTDVDGNFAAIGSSGRASTQRSGFGITLDAKPNRPAVLLVGIEQPSVTAVDLTFLGAPGCFLGVRPFLRRFTTTDAKGQALEAFPRPATLSKDSVVLNAQWVVDARGVNALGMMTSATARIVVRD
jgi:hypothetical protein